MPFAFWPAAPVVSQAWLDFLDFASVRADGTWLFRGHGDAAFDLIPAIGRQPSAAAYRRADEKILFEDFESVISKRTDSPSLNGWRLPSIMAFQRACSI